MRIGMMADVYKPYVSGITNYITLSKRYLEKLGHEVFVFTFGDLDYQDDESNILRSPGLPLVDTGLYVSFRYTGSAQRLLHTMDVVHVHHPFLSGTLALRYCASRGIPTVFTNHTRYDLYSQAYLPSVLDGVSGTFLKAYMPSFCRSINLIFAPSLGMRSVLEQLGVDVPIEVVPNGVDLTLFHKQIEPIDRQQYGFKPDDVVLIYVGRLGPEKNIPFLLRAFNGLAQTYDHVGLMIVGDGPERGNLEDRVHHMKLETRVHFTGMIPFETVARYLTMSDAFVTASVTEVHPLTMLEAMAAGLPVTGIVSPGIGDTIENGVTGYLADTEDLALFTAKLVRMATDHDSRRLMGQKAKEVVEYYSIERTTTQVLEHYQKLTRQFARRRHSLQARWLRFFDRFFL